MDAKQRPTDNLDELLKMDKRSRDKLMTAEDRKAQLGQLQNLKQKYQRETMYHVETCLPQLLLGHGGVKSMRSVTTQEAAYQVPGKDHILSPKLEYFTRDDQTSPPWAQSLRRYETLLYAGGGLQNDTTDALVQWWKLMKYRETKVEVFSFKKTSGRHLDETSAAELIAQESAESSQQTVGGEQAQWKQYQGQQQPQASSSKVPMASTMPQTQGSQASMSGLGRAATQQQLLPQGPPAGQPRQNKAQAVFSQLSQQTTPLTAEQMRVLYAWQYVTEDNMKRNFLKISPTLSNSADRRAKDLYYHFIKSVENTKPVIDKYRPWVLGAVIGGQITQNHFIYLAIKHEELAETQKSTHNKLLEAWNRVVPEQERREIARRVTPRADVSESAHTPLSDRSSSRESRLRSATSGQQSDIEEDVEEEVEDSDHDMASNRSRSSSRSRYSAGGSRISRSTEDHLRMVRSNEDRLTEILRPDGWKLHLQRALLPSPFPGPGLGATGGPHS